MKFKSNLETKKPSVLKLFLDEDGKHRFWMGIHDRRKLKAQILTDRSSINIYEDLVRKGYVTCPEHWIWSSAHPASQ